MRIAGGIYRGRRFDVPAREVRPTTERVREALFSSLGERLAGARVLDLFAGSGALGMEALSRGAQQVCWVEKERAVMKLLQRNVKPLDVGRASCFIHQDALQFLNRYRGPAFDLVFADPPYDTDGRYGWVEKTLRAMEASPILRPQGLLVYEQATLEPEPARAGWSVLHSRSYGKTRLVFLALSGALPGDADQTV